MAQSRRDRSAVRPDDAGRCAIPELDLAKLTAGVAAELTAEQFLQQPYISKPLRLLDCDYPCDSGSAVIFTTEERARDLQQPVVLVDSYAMASTHDMNFEIQPDMVRTAPHHCAERLWARTELTPADVDVAQLYDAFTITPILFLEDLGFCAKGDGGPLAASGAIAPGGALPLNTNGGGLSYTHPGMYGLHAIVEAVRQLRGECGERQVKDARTAICHGTGGILAASATAILSTER